MAKRWLDRFLTVLAMASVLCAAGAWLWSQQASADLFRVDSLYGGPMAAGSTGATVVVWVNSRCAPCNETMPFYAELARSTSARVVVTGSESVDVLREYIRGFDLRADKVSSWRDGIQHFAGTPTLLMVSPDRRVLSVWLGKIPIVDRVGVHTKILQMSKS